VNINSNSISVNGFGQQVVAKEQEPIPAFFQDLLPFLDDTMTSEDKATVLENILQIPESKRENLIEYLHRFCVNENYTLTLRFILQFIDCFNQLSDEERYYVLSPIMPMFRKISLDEAEKLFVVFKKLALENEKNRVYLFYEVLPKLTNKHMGWLDKFDVLAAIGKLPEGASSYKAILPLLNQNMKPEDIVNIANKLAHIPKKTLSKLIEDAYPFIEGPVIANDTTEDWDRMANFLVTVSLFPEETRARLVDDTFPLTNMNMGWGDIVSVMKAMQKIPEEERPDLIGHTQQYVGTTTLRPGIIIDCLETLYCIPKEQRKAFIDFVKPLQPVLTSAFGREALFIFYLLTGSLRTEEGLMSCTERAESNRQGHIRALISSLEEKFQSEKTSPQLLLKMAYFVTKYDINLGLVETDPLVQQAIEIISANSIEGEKNPFSLYRKLQVLAREPTQFIPLEYEVTERKTAFRLQHLQEVAEAFRVSRQELPEDATEEAWDALVNGLKNKVEADEVIKNKIPELYTGVTWEEIWNNSLSAPYFSGLLKSSTGKVSIAEAHFRALVHNILTKEKEVKPGELFSEQEDALIKQAIAIQRCSTGKNQGVAIVYNLLPSEYKYKAKGLSGCRTESDEQKIRAQVFIAEVVQTLLFNQFTDSFVKVLIEADEVNEPPHQILYLKNLIGKTVGLAHDVTFDRYSGVLYDELVEKSRNSVLKVFFDRLTPCVLVKELVKKINSDSSKKTLVREFLTSDPVIMEESYDYGDDGFTLILNERGALTLLRQTGYLT
jgi:hypothetical protein